MSTSFMIFLVSFYYINTYMMIVEKNKITTEMIKEWQEYWNNNQEKSHMLGEHNGEPIAYRIAIDHDSASFQHINNIIKNHFKNFKIAFAGYQRQYHAHNLHMDEPGIGRTYMTYTLLIPLLEDPRIKTVIFKNHADSNQDIHKKLITFGEDDNNKIEKTNKVSENELVKHTPQHWKTGDYFVDHLELDGTFEYKLGNYVIFDTNQIHASNNWKSLPEYQNKNGSKDIVQVHFIDLDTKV
jgi:hypothetical protein